MSGPGIYLFFTGLLLFVVGFILVATLSSSERHGWMWALLILGVILAIIGGILWFTSSTLTTLTTPSSPGGETPLSQLAGLAVLA